MLISLFCLFICTLLLRKCLSVEPFEIQISILNLDQLPTNWISCTPSVHRNSWWGVEWVERDLGSMFLGPQTPHLLFPQIDQSELDVILVLFPQLSFHNHLSTTWQKKGIPPTISESYWVWLLCCLGRGCHIKQKTEMRKICVGRKGEHLVKESSIKKNLEGEV